MEELTDIPRLGVPRFILTAVELDAGCIDRLALLLSAVNPEQPEKKFRRICAVEQGYSDAVSRVVIE